MLIWIITHVSTALVSCKIGKKLWTTYLFLSWHCIFLEAYWIMLVWHYRSLYGQLNYFELGSRDTWSEILISSNMSPHSQTVEHYGMDCISLSFHSGCHQWHPYRTSPASSGGTLKGSLHHLIYCGM